jgi:hypothetical protein
MSLFVHFLSRGMYDERETFAGCRLSYMTLCMYFVNVRGLTNVPFFFSLHTVIGGNVRFKYDEKRVFVRALLTDCLLIFSLR